MFESGVPTEETGAREVQINSRNDNETSRDDLEEEKFDSLQETDPAGIVESLSTLHATGRNLLCDSCDEASTTKITTGVLKTIHGKCEELSGINERDKASSDDGPRDCVVESETSIQFNKDQAFGNENVAIPQQLQVQGPREEETVSQITSVDTPSSVPSKLDLINVVEQDKIVVSDSYGVISSPSAERLEGSNPSPNQNCDNTNCRKASSDFPDVKEVEVVLLPPVPRCNESAAAFVAKTTKSDYFQSKSPPASDGSGLKIQVFPQQGISLVSNSQILTTDVIAFSSQVPTILTEGDAEESDGQMTTVPASSSVIITGDSTLGPHLTTANDTVTIVTPDSATVTTDTLITQSSPLEIQNVTSEQLTVIPAGEYNHGIILSDQQSVLLGGMTCMVPQGVVNESAVQISLPCSQAMASSLPQMQEGVQGICCDREDQKLHMCPHPQCDKVCSKAYKLKLHLLSHTGERPYKCPHKDCGWAFTTAYKLKRHVRGHTGERPYACTHEGCSKRFTTAYNLKTHIRAHLRSNNMACSYEGCDKTFPSAHKLRVHERKHELEQKPFRCEVEGCGKEFTGLSTLTSHIKSHTSERPHACPAEGCEKRFTKASKLKLHVRTHTGERPFACSYEHCNWSFTSAYKLKRHMRKHTGERPFVCKFDGCGKSFTRSSHLKTHTLVHTGEKPYTCPVDGCGKAFTAGSSLNVHMRKHTGEKPFKCEADGCNKAYTTAANLRAHQRRHETHKKLLDEDGSEMSSSHVEYMDINPMSTTGTVVNTSGVPEVAYNSIHSFSSDDFHPDDVTSLSEVGVHLLTCSIVSSSSNQLTFSTIDHHHTQLDHDVDREVGDRHTSREHDRESVDMSTFQSDVENREQLGAMDEGTQVDVAEFIVQAEDGSSTVLHRSPTVAHEHGIHSSNADAPKHGVFDLPIVSVLGHLTSVGTSKQGEHQHSRKRKRKSSGSSRRRSLDFRTAVHPEDQFAPPTVIFQDEAIKSGSSDVEGDSEGISCHVQRSPEVPLTTSSRQSLGHLVPDNLQVHMPHTIEQEITSHETVIGIDPEEPDVHPITSSDIHFRSHLPGVHEGDEINKSELSSYIENNSSHEQEETNGDAYHESTINLQDLR